MCLALASENVDELHFEKKKRKNHLLLMLFVLEILQSALRSGGWAKLEFGMVMPYGSAPSAAAAF